MPGTGMQPRTSGRLLRPYPHFVHPLKKVALMKLLEEVKKSSSKWIKTRGQAYRNFYWQDGYGAFSVNPSQIEVVVRYIQNQYTHHQKITFQDECRGIYQKYEMAYDERYVWD